MFRNLYPAALGHPMGVFFNGPYHVFQPGWRYVPAVPRPGLPPRVFPPPVMPVPLPPGPWRMRFPQPVPMPHYAMGPVGVAWAPARHFAGPRF